MRIAVAGGTGVLGRYIVAAAEQAGHQVQVLSRRSGVDLMSRSGLNGALDGVEVIVDAANAASLNRDKATKFFTTVTRNLHEAGSAVGVRRLVTMSIVHIDQVTENPYYRAKLAHEEAAKEGPLAATVVRATQFHEFPAQVMLRSQFGPLVFMPHMKVQSVAARALGSEVVAIAAGDETPPLVNVAGPEVRDLVDLARAIVRYRGQRARVVALPVPGGMGRKFRAGALTADPDARVVGPGFDEWLMSGDVDAIGR